MLTSAVYHNLMLLFYWWPCFRSGFFKKHRLDCFDHFQFSISAVSNCSLFDVYTHSEVTINIPKGLMLTVSSLCYFKDL